MRKPTSKEWIGVQRLISNYVKPDTDDLFLIIYSTDAASESVWLKVLLENAGFEVRMVWMIPLKDPEFEGRLQNSMPTEVGRNLNVLVLEQQTLSHDEEIYNCVRKYESYRTKTFRLITAKGLLFSEGLKIDPEEISGRNTTFLKKLMPANKIRVISNSGTNLEISFDSKYRWISNRGVWEPGRVVILPPGEVATYPLTVNGTFVADFAINVNINTDIDVRLDKHPVIVNIVDSTIDSFSCSDDTVYKFLCDCFEGQCAKKVGEVGFGTNVGVTKPVNVNSHINERHSGLHLGFGESNQPPDLVGYGCHIHTDLIGTGGEIILENGDSLNFSSYLISKEMHPSSTRDEDAFSSDGSGGLAPTDDCCGYTNVS